jgi:hypothetical protein
LKQGAVVLLIVLAACSGGNTSLDFTTDGVTRPAAACSTDPRNFASVDSLGDYGQGICTVRDAYRLNAMDGVGLSKPAIVNCAVANGFNNWLTQVAQPAAQRNYNSPIISIDIAASYACRPRNGVRGAKLSEHGFGNALDVSGFSFADGRHVDVASDYYSSNFLKSVRADACGIFHTVLGPGSDSSHRDHLHFDLEERRSGQNFCH